VTGSLGTSVATETCGQARPLKFRITVWEYWICVEVTAIRRACVIGTGGSMRKVGEVGES
jgi:hypothetical protein